MNVAVTGVMGSGKSVVSAALAENLGAMAASADTMCRDLLTVGNAGWIAMQKSFPASFFLNDGQVNRPVLRKALFADPSIREKLDSLLHPLVRQELADLFGVAARKRLDLVTEVPLLFEKGWQNDFDYTVVVYASEALSCQMPLSAKVGLADTVIENSGALAVTLEQLEQLQRRLSGEPHFKGKTNG